MLVLCIIKRDLRGSVGSQQVKRSGVRVMCCCLGKERFRSQARIPVLRQQSLKSEQTLSVISLGTSYQISYYTSTSSWLLCQMALRLETLQEAICVLTIGKMLLG